MGKTGTRWLAINYDKVRQFRYNDEAWLDKIEEEPKYNINIFHINTDMLYYANMYLPESIWSVIAEAMPNKKGQK